MKFTLGEDDSYWIAKTTLNACTIVLRLETEDETESDAEATGKTVLDHVQKHWQTIRRSLVGDLE